MAIQFYAIKHLPTGKYLPRSMGKVTRDFTTVKPMEPSVMAPRLFNKEQNAKVALGWWLGETVAINETNHDKFIDRIPAEMAVVPVLLALP